MSIVNLIIILNCIVLLYLFINIKNNESFAVYIKPDVKNKMLGIQETPIKQETFDDNEHLIIKKTHNYNLIYSKPESNLYVWEPKPIDNYFPIGQTITETKYKPKFASILVKSTEKNKPKSYQLIEVLEDKKMSVWKPIPRKGYGVVSYIFSKTIPPSINKIRMVEQKFLEKSSIDKMITKDNLNLFNIQFSDNFISGSEDMKDVVSYYVPNDKMRPEKKIIIENTSNYKLIWSDNNTDNNKFIAVWRPLPARDFRSLGDVVLDNDDDPNDNLQIPTIHKDYVKPILYFKPPIIYKKGKVTVKIWMPETYEGTVSLGQVVSFDDEPSEDIISSLPLEYLVPSNLENVWNSIGNKSKINIWSNNGFLKAVKGMKQPSEITYKLNKEEFFSNFNLDELDVNMNIQINFKKIKKNINKVNLKKLIKQKLASKLDIIESRINVKNIDILNNKIDLQLLKRNINSPEKLTNKLVEQLYDMITKYNIPIMNNSSIEIVLKDLIYNQEGSISTKEDFSESSGVIKLNNSEWKNKFS